LSTVVVDVGTTKRARTGICRVAPEGAVAYPLHLDAKTAAALGIFFAWIAEFLGLRDAKKDKVRAKSGDAFAMPAFRALLKAFIGADEALRALDAKTTQALLIVVTGTAEGSGFDLAGVEAICTAKVIAREGQVIPKVRKINNLL